MIQFNTEETQPVHFQDHSMMLCKAQQVWMIWRFAVTTHRIKNKHTNVSTP